LLEISKIIETFTNSFPLLLEIDGQEGVMMDGETRPLLSE